MLHSYFYLLTFLHKDYNERVHRHRFLLIFLVFVLATLGFGLGWWRYLVWRDHSQDGPILAAARQSGVEPSLVKAVVWRESRFNARARGSRGEIGLMQVLPKAAAKDWAEAERVPELAPVALLDAGTNTRIGAWYLERLLKRYAGTDNPAAYALADYNAGRSNVLKWKTGAGATNSAAFLAQIQFPSTRSYVATVLRRWHYYQPIFPPKGR